MKEYKKILIVRLSSIGDIILTSLFIRVLRNMYPNSIIDFICANNFVSLIEFNPRLDSVKSYDKKWDLKTVELFKRDLLKKHGKYDAIFDLQNNLRSRILTGGLSASIFRYPKNRLKKLSLVYLKKDISKSDNLPIPLNYLKAGGQINLNDDGLGLELWLPNDNKSEYFNKKQSEIKVISIAPGSKHYTKRYPTEKFIELISLIKKEYSDYKIQLVGGKEDINICNEIERAFSGEIKNYCGDKTILESAEIIDKSNVLITNDSMALHIACARQTPVIAIFGSTVLDFGFGPFRCVNRIVQSEIKCRPCTHIGKNECPKRHFNCMHNIQPQAILNELKTILYK